MGITTVVYEIENRSKRAFIVGLESRITGGEIQKGPNGENRALIIGPGKTVKVTEVCGKYLVDNFKEEIKLIRKASSRKG